MEIRLVCEREGVTAWRDISRVVEMIEPKEGGLKDLHERIVAAIAKHVTHPFEVEIRGAINP